MNIRRKCKVIGCFKLGRNKGFYNGITRYDNVCEIHHRTQNRAYYNKKQSIVNSACEKCGWDKAPCDRHRKVPSKGYVRGNVEVLCPNCHRIEENRKWKKHIKKKQGAESKN